MCEGESTGTLVLTHIWVRGRKVLEPSSCGLFNHVLQWMRMECWRRDKLLNGDVEVVWVEYIIYFIDCFEPCCSLRQDPKHCIICINMMYVSCFQVSNRRERFVIVASIGATVVSTWYSHLRSILEVTYDVYSTYRDISLNTTTRIFGLWAHSHIDLCEDEAL